MTLACAALAVLSLAGLLVFLQVQPDKKEGVDNAVIITGVLTVVLAVLAIADPLVKLLRPNRGKPSTDSEVADAQRVLARETVSWWREQASRQNVTLPAVINVRWEAPDSVPHAGRNDVLGNDGVKTAGKRRTYAGLLDRGALDQLYSLYMGLPKGKLVVVGGPGTGKTGALMLLLIEACDEALRGPSTGFIAPVPVLIPLTGWDPQQNLLVWVKHVLRRDSPYLRSQKFGGDALSALVDDRHVALFLDGLDEMPDDVRSRAIRAISQLSDFRVVLTSRTDEYREAASHGHLPNAAVIELSPVDSTTAAKYLRQGHESSDQPAWEQLARSITRHPTCPAAQALDRPLTLALLRQTYADGTDPTELLDQTRFPSAKSIKDRLMARVLPTAFPEEQIATTGLLLGWIASQTRAAGTRDIDWWRVRRWYLPYATLFVSVIMAAVAGSVATAITINNRTAVAVGICMLTGGCLSSYMSYRSGIRRYPRVPVRGTKPRMAASICLGCLVLGPSLLFTYAAQTKIGIFPAVLFGILIGFAEGTACALIALRDTPIRAMVRQRPTGREYGVGLVTGLASGICVGLLTKFAFALVMGAIVTLLALGLISLTRPPDKPEKGRSPLTSWKDDLRGGLLASGVGAVFAFISTFVLLQSILNDYRPVITALYLALTCAAFVLVLVSQSAALAICGVLLRLRLGRTYRVMQHLALSAELRVLRQVGAVYQFRHGDLHDYLADEYEKGALQLHNAS